MTGSSEEKFRQQILLLLSVLIFCAGLWTARESGQKTDLRMRRELARKAMATGGPGINEEEPPFAREGHPGISETVKSPVRDAEGKLIGVPGVARETPVRKKADEQIQSQLAKLTCWYQATPGSKTRALEPKKEINGILQHNDEPPRYKETINNPKTDTSFMYTI